jgi:hypothetical protein
LCEQRVDLGLERRIGLRAADEAGRLHVGTRRVRHRQEERRGAGDACGLTLSEILADFQRLPAVAEATLERRHVETDPLGLSRPVAELGGRLLTGKQLVVHLEVPALFGAARRLGGPVEYGRVAAAHGGIATVRRTGIPVVAVRGTRAHAHAGLARVGLRTRIAVVANRSVGQHGVRALARPGVARPCAMALIEGPAHDRCARAQPGSVAHVVCRAQEGVVACSARWLWRDPVGLFAHGGGHPLRARGRHAEQQGEHG